MGDSSQRRNLGTHTSQIRIAGPKNSAVYFDNKAVPTAAPTVWPRVEAPLPGADGEGFWGDGRELSRVVRQPNS